MSVCFQWYIKKRWLIEESNEKEAQKKRKGSMKKMSSKNASNHASHLEQKDSLNSRHHEEIAYNYRFVKDLLYTTCSQTALGMLFWEWAGAGVN